MEKAEERTEGSVNSTELICQSEQVQSTMEGGRGWLEGASVKHVCIPNIELFKIIHNSFDT